MMRQFELWTVLFFAVSVCFHLVMYFGFHRRDWLAFPLVLHRSWMFADFTVFAPKYAFFHTTSFFSTGFPMVYPTPVAALLAIFFKLGGRYAVHLFVLFIVFAFALPVGLFCRNLISRGLPPPTALPFVVIVCVLSWPFACNVNGANSEVFVWLAMALAMWAYATDRLWSAAVLFGVAASLKLYPFVFVALFLNRTHFAKAIVAALSFTFTSLAAFLIVGPTVSTAFYGFLHGFRFAAGGYFAAWRPLEHGVDHSLFGLIKFCLHFLHWHDQHSYVGLLVLYQFTTALGGLLLYFGRIRHMPLLNQVLTLSIVSVYFTPYSGDGTLIHLYYPLAMLFLLSLRADREQLTIPGLKWLTATMVFCLSIESFVAIPLRETGMRFEGPVHAVALGFMLIASLRYPLGPPPSPNYAPLVLSQPETSWLRSADCDAGATVRTT